MTSGFRDLRSYPLVHRAPLCMYVSSRRQKWTSRIRTSGVPVVTIDKTAEEEEIDATKKEQQNSTENNQIGERIGQEGERRKSYSAAVIDGIKRNTRIYVGDSIIRKTDSRLSKGRT